MVDRQPVQIADGQSVQQWQIANDEQAVQQPQAQLCQSQQQSQTQVEQRWLDQGDTAIVCSLKAKLAELGQEVVRLETGHQWVQDEACKAMAIACKLQVGVVMDRLQQSDSGSDSSPGGSSGNYKSAKQHWHRWQSSSHNEAESSGSEATPVYRRNGRRFGHRRTQGRHELLKPRPMAAAMKNAPTATIAVQNSAAMDPAVAAAAAASEGSPVATAAAT